jgi:hypothetical protein
VAVVRDGDDSRLAHLADLGQFFPQRTFGHRPDGINVDDSGLLRAPGCSGSEPDCR